MSRDAAGEGRASLFEAPATQAPAHVVLATIDGAARGNPGPAAYGVVFEDARGNVKEQLARRLGKATNNVAEYRALLAALTHARQRGWKALKVRTDSELLARQIEGAYKVKSPDLKPLHEEARGLIAVFDYFRIESVPRKFTRAADKLANAALDGKMGKQKLTTGKRARTFRAVYQDGVLKPLESLGLPDGAEVEIALRIKG